METNLLEKSNQLYKDVKEFSDRTKKKIDTIQSRIDQDDVLALESQKITLPFELSKKLVKIAKDDSCSVEQLVIKMINENIK